MENNISIPKELLAQIDFSNTINGGVVESTASAWQDTEGYRLVLKAPGVDPDSVQIKVENNRFVIFHPINVLENEYQMPHYFVNLPLDPNVDVEKITAKVESDGRIFVKAPFNGWAKGKSHDIELGGL